MNPDHYLSRPCGVECRISALVTGHIATSENYQIDHERKIFKQARLTEKRIEIYKEKRKFEEEEKCKQNIKCQFENIHIFNTYV